MGRCHSTTVYIVPNDSKNSLNQQGKYNINLYVIMSQIPNMATILTECELRKSGRSTGQMNGTH